VRNDKTNMTMDEIRERLSQADEMSNIWDESSDPIRMYLKGCIVTAAALARKKDECLKTG